MMNPIEYPFYTDSLAATQTLSLVNFIIIVLSVGSLLLLWAIYRFLPRFKTVTGYGLVIVFYCFILFALVIIGSPSIT
jgi:Flp pilus assembly protein protease CpaA